MSVALRCATASVRCFFRAAASAFFCALELSPELAASLDRGFARPAGLLLNRLEHVGRRQSISACAGLMYLDQLFWR